MKALVVVAHGSRRKSSNDEVVQVTEALSQKLPEGFDMVNTGFLELAQPLIPESIQTCIESGATEVHVLPYFLSAGRHVVEDVPAEIDIVAKKYPHVKIKMLTYVGGLPGMQDLMLSALD